MKTYRRLSVGQWPQKWLAVSDSYVTFEPMSVLADVSQ